MHMYKTVGQEMRNNAAAQSMSHMLNNARSEAKADAAIAFSAFLDRLASHAVVNALSAVEIIQLLREESVNFDNAGRDCDYEVRYV